MQGLHHSYPWYCRQHRKHCFRAEYVISVSVTTSDDSACNKAIYYMADLVKERSGGRVELDVYCNGTMANDVGSVEGVQMGTIGMTLVSSANYTQFDSNQAVFDLPFLFPTKEDAYRFFESDLAGKLAESLAITVSTASAIWTTATGC